MCQSGHDASNAAAPASARRRAARAIYQSKNTTTARRDPSSQRITPVILTGSGPSTNPGLGSTLFPVQPHRPSRFSGHAASWANMMADVAQSGMSDFGCLAWTTIGERSRVGASDFAGTPNKDNRRTQRKQATKLHLPLHASATLTATLRP